MVVICGGQRGHEDRGGAHVGSMYVHACQGSQGLGDSFVGKGVGGLGFGALRAQKLVGLGETREIEIELGLRVVRRLIVSDQPFLDATLSA